MTDVDIDDFVVGLQSPERNALLRVIGAFMVNPQGAEAEERSGGDAGREWSDTELKELGPVEP